MCRFGPCLILIFQVAAVFVCGRSLISEIEHCSICEFNLWMNGPRLQGRVLQLSFMVSIMLIKQKYSWTWISWISLVSEFVLASHMASEQILLARQQKTLTNGKSNTNYIDCLMLARIVSQGMIITKINK